MNCFSRRTLASAALPLAIGGLALLAPSAMGATATNVSVGITGPATLAAGENGTWVITVTNSGADWIQASRVIVDNPAFGRYGLTPDSVPAGGWLAPGASLTYTQTGRYGMEICGEKANVTNDAVVRLSKGTETTHSDNGAEVSSRVLSCRADLGIVKSADRATYLPGETVTWTMVVTNHGTTGVPMSEVSVSDPMLADMVPVDVPADGWLDLGESVTYRGTSIVTAEHCGTVTNTAYVTHGGYVGLPDVNPGNDSGSATVSVSGGACTPATPVPPRVLPATRPALVCPATRMGVEISAPRVAVAGQLMRITVTGRNTGRNVARGAKLQYRVPSGAALRGRPAGTTLRAGVLTVNLGDLSAGAVRRLGVTLMLDRAAGARVHRASLKAGCAVAANRLSGTRVTPVQGPARPAVTG